LAISALRAVLVALAVAATLPMIDAYGILATNALCAILVWISFMYVWSFQKFFFLLIIDILDLGYSGLCYTIKYGEQMRAWIDVGYSTAEDH
jgi:hypothetical protein